MRGHESNVFHAWAAVLRHFLLGRVMPGEGDRILGVSGQCVSLTHDTCTIEWHARGPACINRGLSGGGTVDIPGGPRQECHTVPTMAVSFRFVWCKSGSPTGHRQSGTSDRCKHGCHSAHTASPSPPPHKAYYLCIGFICAILCFSRAAIVAY